MNALSNGIIVVVPIMFGIMGCCFSFNIVYFVIQNIKDRKKKPKIEDLQRQLEYERAKNRSIKESYELSYEEHKALALAVMLCKNNNLNLKQMEELGLQRYNALQTRHNFISNEAYEELVKNYIIRPEKRRSYTDGEKPLKGERYERTRV